MFISTFHFRTKAPDALPELPNSISWEQYLNLFCSLSQGDGSPGSPYKKPLKLAGKEKLKPGEASPWLNNFKNLEI